MVTKMLTGMSMCSPRFSGPSTGISRHNLPPLWMLPVVASACNSTFRRQFRKAPGSHPEFHTGTRYEPEGMTTQATGTPDSEAFAEDGGGQVPENGRRERYRIPREDPCT